MSDRITYDENRHRVIVKKANGIEYTFLPLNNTDERRGMRTLYVAYMFKLSRRSMAKALKHFYKDDTLRYLERYGYVDNAGVLFNFRP